MNYQDVNLTFRTYWQFKEFPYLKVTRCKKVINCKTSKLLKYHTRGYFINDRYFKKSELNNYLEKIKSEKTPF